MLTLKVTEIKQVTYGDSYSTFVDAAYSIDDCSASGRKVFAGPYLLPPTDAEVVLGDEVTLDLNISNFSYQAKSGVFTDDCDWLLTYAGVTYPVVRKDAGEYVYLQEPRVIVSRWHNQSDRDNCEPTSGLHYVSASDVMVR